MRAVALTRHWKESGMAGGWIMACMEGMEAEFGGPWGRSWRGNLWVMIGTACGCQFDSIIRPSIGRCLAVIPP